VTQKFCHLTGSHLEVAVESRKLTHTVCLTFYKAVAFRRQSRDRKWCHVTSDDRKWPISDVIWPEVTWSGCRGSKTGLYCKFHFLQGCCSQEAVTWPGMKSRDLRWPDVTWKWRHLTGSHLEVAVEGRKLAYIVHVTSYKAVARRRRQSRDRKWRHMTSGTGSDPDVTSFDRKSTEVAVETRKLAYTINFTFYKAVACRRMQLHDGKWRQMTSGDQKWAVCDVIWPEVTWMWL